MRRPNSSGLPGPSPFQNGIFPGSPGAGVTSTRSRISPTFVRARVRARVRVQVQVRVRAGPEPGRAARACASFAAGRSFAAGARLPRRAARLSPGAARLSGRAGPSGRRSPAGGRRRGRCCATRLAAGVSGLAGPDAQRGAQFLGEPAAARVAVGRVLRQRGGQHRVHGRGQPGAPRADGRRVRVDLRVHQGLALVRTERRSAAQQLEPGARQRVEIGPAVHGRGPRSARGQGSRGSRPPGPPR